MSRKTLAFKMPAPKQPAPTAADAWVGARTADVAEANVVAMTPAAEAAPREPMKRMTLEVPLHLHRRVKAQCAERGTDMVTVFRALLEAEFPEKARP